MVCGGHWKRDVDVSRQMIPGSNVSRTLARTGVDWVLVDCELLERS